MTEKMHQTIFYSWQSDLPDRTNRAFILDALEQAAQAVRSDASVGVDPVIDRDTAGVAGSPGIAATIFAKIAKIAKADIFVPDVSLVTSHHAKRHSPNPNVPLELGFAMSQLSWDRVVMVMNTAFGDPTRLPFDLRGHRVVTYKCSDEPGAIKTGEQRALEKKLTDAITAILRERASRRNAEDRKHLDSLQSAAVEFQTQRLERLAAGHAPVTMSSGQLVCVHVVPFDAKMGTTTIDVGRLYPQRTSLPPFGSTGFNRTFFNTDGLLRYVHGRDGSTSGFLQLFRNGVIESVDSSMMIGRGKRSDGLLGPYFCKTLVTFLDGACRLYEELQIQPPISVLMALLGEKLRRLVPAHDVGGSGYYVGNFAEDQIVLPPVQLVDLKADIRPLLRRSLDALWQAAGAEACSCYTDDGKWSASG